MNKDKIFSSMEEMIAEFPNQLRDALRIWKNSNLSPVIKEKIDNILIVGLGGSGIGGDFVQAICRTTSSIPIHVSKQYTIPHWVGRNTLVICNSYSGNTEETLNAYRLAMDTGAQLICVSSGGKLIEAAEKNKQTYIRLPDNYSSPRACLGYSVFTQLGIMDKLNLVHSGWNKEVLTIAKNLSSKMQEIRQKSVKIVSQITTKDIVIYTEDAMEPLALRWRQQINENAKTLCWHNIIPEMNHNELVGWKDKKDIAVIFLRSSLNAPRNALRMDINKEIIGKYTQTILELCGEGESYIEQVFHLVHLGDWVSYELAQMKGRNVVEVKVIDYLKSELSKIKEA